MAHIFEPVGFKDLIIMFNEHHGSKCIRNARSTHAVVTVLMNIAISELESLFCADT